MHELEDDFLPPNHIDEMTLLDAISFQDYRTMEYLLDRDVSANAKDAENRPFILIAALNSDFEAVKLLHRYGADLNVKTEDGRSLIHISCDSGDEETLRFLFENQVDDSLLREDLANIKDKADLPPLVYAVLRRRNHLLTFLLDQGADFLKASPPKTRSPLYWAGFANNVPALSTFLSKVDSEKLQHAIESGVSDEKFSPIVSDLKNIFYVATAQAFIPTINFLTPNFFEVNSEHMLKDFFCDKGHIKILLNWLFQGNENQIHLANVLVDNFGPIEEIKFNPLHWATAFEGQRTLQALIKHGFEVNAGDSQFGLTPLMLACISGERDIVKYLLDLGADHRVKSKEKKTAINYLEKFRNFFSHRLILKDLNKL